MSDQNGAEEKGNQGSDEKEAESTVHSTSPTQEVAPEAAVMETAVQGGGEEGSEKEVDPSSGKEAPTSEELEYVDIGAPEKVISTSASSTTTTSKQFHVGEVRELNEKMVRTSFLLFVVNVTEGLIFSIYS